MKSTITNTYVVGGTGFVGSNVVREGVHDSNTSTELKEHAIDKLTNVSHTNDMEVHSSMFNGLINMSFESLTIVDITTLSVSAVSLLVLIGKGVMDTHLYLLDMKIKKANLRKVKGE